MGWALITDEGEAICQAFINAAAASLVALVISNCKGLPVFCSNTVALLETELLYAHQLL